MSLFIHHGDFYVLECETVRPFACKKLVLVAPLLVAINTLNVQAK